MKRMKVLFGQRRMQVLVILAVVLLAVAGVYGSGASFTASAANPGNVFTAGALSITDKDTTGVDQDGSVMLDLQTAAMAPGDTRTGTCVIKNTGSVSGVFKLSGSMDTSAATYDAGFADYLLLTVYEDGAAIPAVTDVPLRTALSSGVNLGSWAAGAEHTYKFSVYFPNGAAGDEDAFMNKTATLNIAWTAVSD